MSHFRTKLSDELQAILGEEAFVVLCQEFGGTRLYVPRTLDDESEIVRAIGRQAAKKLCNAIAPDRIRVPLARAIRALHYRRNGLSNARIARKLGITENGVAKLLKRAGEASSGK